MRSSARAWSPQAKSVTIRAAPTIARSRPRKGRRRSIAAYPTTTCRMYSE
ncbi:hypothetical protein ACFPRL_23755 [Pseudoclavibacter helvolus]